MNLNGNISLLPQLFLIGLITACEEIWFISDAFAFTSFEQHFKDREAETASGYVHNTFDIKGFFTNKFTHYDQNAVSRICNTLITALQEKIKLPKWIIIVMDDDLIKYIDVDSKDIAEVLSRLLDNIMKEHNKTIAIHKDFLPPRAQRKHFPQFIWIKAPVHNNFSNNAERIKFNSALTNMVKFHANTSVLELKKGWDPENHNLFDSYSRRYTREGFSSYWAAIDKMVKFADTILIKKQMKTLERERTKQSSIKQQQPSKITDQYDPFHWENVAYLMTLSNNVLI